MTETPGTRRQIFSNLGKLSGGKAIAGLLSLGYLIIAARALGPASYGVLVLVHGYVLLVGGIIGFPGWHAIVRYGTEAIADDDEARLWGLLRFTTLIELGCGVLAIGVAMLLAPYVGPRLGWSPEAQALAVPYCFAILGSVRSTPAGLLQLLGRFDLLGLHNVIAPLSRIIGSLIVVSCGYGLTGFLFAWLASALVEWLGLWVMGLWVMHRRYGLNGMRGTIATVRARNLNLLRFMLAANADVTLSELAGRLVPLTIGWVLGAAPAGLFAVAQRVTVVFAQAGLMLGQAAYPELARQIARGGSMRQVAQTAWHAVGVAMLAGVPVLIVIALWPAPIIALFGGTKFAAAAGVLIWLAVARYIQLAMPPLAAVLTAFGRPDLSVAANLISNIGAYPLLPLLLLWAGLSGAGWFAIGQALLTLALLILFVRKRVLASETQ